MTELKPCREAFEEWWKNDETLLDSGIETSLTKAKDLTWLGYIAAWNRRSGGGEWEAEQAYAKLYGKLQEQYHALLADVEKVRAAILSISGAIALADAWQVEREQTHEYCNLDGSSAEMGRYVYPNRIRLYRALLTHIQNKHKEEK